MTSDQDLIIVLGVGRSGTNLLADALAADPALHNTVENRYIWNFRQASFRTDPRHPDEATPPVAAYIARHFDRIAERSGKRLIDKTPSNVFRVGFASRIFPKARVVHIIRDGRDNVFSRLREWHGGNAVVARQEADGTVAHVADFRRSLIRRRIERIREMLRTDSLPPDRWPAFLWDNAAIAARQVISRTPVRYAERAPGLAEHLRTHGLASAAAAQWRDGVMQALHAGRRLGPERYLEIRYEEIVRDPARTGSAIATFLGLDPESPMIAYLVETAGPQTVRDWADPVYAPFLDEIEPVLRPTMEFLGYPWADARP